MKQPSKLTPRAQEMYALVEKYFNTGLSQKAFCEQEGIVYSTFHWWLRKYKDRHSISETTNEQTTGTGAFVPVHITPPEPSANDQVTCQIEYPNGVVLRFMDVNVQVLSQLINLPVD